SGPRRAAALVDRGEGAAALAVHDGIDPAALGNLVAERRAHHYLDMARACVQVGDIERAGRALTTAERTAPAEVRCRPIAVELIGQILHRTKGEPTPEVRRLAEQVGALDRSEEHTSELQSRENLVCRLLLEKKKADVQ